MKNPTSNGIDLYQLGNDYMQEPSAYFDTESYKDGIYTSATAPISAASGLNKRIFNVPQDEWSDPTTPGFSGEKILSDDYATGIVVENV